MHKHPGALGAATGAFDIAPVRGYFGADIQRFPHPARVVARPESAPDRGRDARDAE
jgi:hypothetical protein